MVAGVSQMAADFGNSQLPRRCRDGVSSGAAGDESRCHQCGAKGFCGDKITENRNQEGSDGFALFYWLQHHVSDWSPWDRMHCLGYLEFKAYAR